MTASTPTGLLVLAMLVGQAAGFARAPKEAAEKGGDVRASRTWGVIQCRLAAPLSAPPLVIHA